MAQRATVLLAWKFIWANYNNYIQQLYTNYDMFLANLYRKAYELLEKYVSPMLKKIPPSKQ